MVSRERGRCEGGRLQGAGMEQIVGRGSTALVVEVLL